MIDLFLVSLFSTFIIIRISSHLLHDKKKYGTNEERSKTLTYILRKITNKDIHHIHLGFLILILTLIFTSFYGLNNFQVVLYGISLSLITDQLIPLMFRKINYFNKKGFLSALFLHLIIATVYFFFNSS
jgi:hypothetical protein